MSWRISGGSEFWVSLAPPCSPDENRLCIPSRSNASALRDRVRLSDIDFFGSLPCGLVEQDEGSDRLIKLLFRPQRPLFDACPLISTRSALSLRSRHLPLPFRDNDACFKRTASLTGLQEFGAFLASLEFPSTYTMLRDSLYLCTMPNVSTRLWTTCLLMSLS
jgi:hypothetical protein